MTMIEYEGEMLDEVQRALDDLGGYSTLLIVRDGRTGKFSADLEAGRSFRMHRGKGDTVREAVDAALCEARLWAVNNEGPED